MSNTLELWVQICKVLPGHREGLKRKICQAHPIILRNIRLSFAPNYKTFTSEGKALESADHFYKNSFKCSQDFPLRSWSVTWLAKNTLTEIFLALAGHIWWQHRNVKHCLYFLSLFCCKCCFVQQIVNSTTPFSDIHKWIIKNKANVCLNYTYSVSKIYTYSQSY